MWIKYKIVPMSHVLAIDQGTSSSRTIIFAAQLRKVESPPEEYPLDYPKSGWEEIDPKALLAFVEIMRIPLLKK